ncbi:MAG: beta-ketoacyl-ACP synthase II [Candidatus Omnitrophota bacterium]
MKDRKRVVITGLGVVAPNGIGLELFWENNARGISGVKNLLSFDVAGLETRIAGEVTGFDPGQYMPAEVLKRTDRYVHLGLASVKMALANSALDLAREDRARIGVIIGSGLGGIQFHEEQMRAALDKGPGRINPLAVPRITSNAVASHIAIESGLTGFNSVISTACASGAHAIGEAFRKIQYGELDACVSGGVEAPLTPITFAAYGALRVLSKRNDRPQEASRPFDRERDGFVLSEGAGILILEELEHARRRKARVYAEVTGYGANSGAHHIVMPDPGGQDAALAMAAALSDAGIKPGDIDYINAHGTATQANDKAETRAIKTVFGEKARVPVSSTKSMIGHSIGAAGAIEALVCALALDRGLIPPTINLKERDPDCDLDYVPGEARRAALKAVLSNSFGFGGCNACLVFQQGDER